MDTFCIIVVLGLAAWASADQMTYNGMFTGQCGDDGLYYMDREKFVICSNGEASEQKCAPGSANNDYGYYHFGHAYDKATFCTVNMVGYGHGYGNGFGHGYGYGNGYGLPYAYNQRFYNPNQYGYQPYGFYPYAYPMPYFYPFGYGGYGRGYGYRGYPYGAPTAPSTPAGTEQAKQ